MLRSVAGVLTQLALNTQTKCGQSAFALEFVRWRRKPRWLPVAKSKLNRVPERKRQPPDEREELKRLYNNYNLQMRSLMQYFREEAKIKEQTSSADNIILSPEQEEEEFQRCMQENESWNAKIAQERELRLQNQRQQTAKAVQEHIEQAKAEEEERLAKIEAIVRREKELAKTYITRENLDEAINHALANPVDHNFSIDLKGNIYRGRDTVPGARGGQVRSEEEQTAAAQN